MKKLLLALLFLPTLLFAEEYNWRVFACDVRIPPAYLEQYPNEKYQMRFNLWLDADKEKAVVGSHYRTVENVASTVITQELLVTVWPNTYPTTHINIDRTRIEGNTEYIILMNASQNLYLIYRGTCKPDHKWTTKF